MSCGNQPAYISVIIVAAFPSVDGTAAQSKVKSQSASRRKNKVKGITITLNLTCHSISAGGPSEASDHRFTLAKWSLTPAGVTEKIHAAWYLIRDPVRGRTPIARMFPVVARFARTTGYHT